MFTLALALLIPAPTPPAFTPGPTDPPIKIKLSDDAVMPGERIKVRIKTAESGYLLVLRLDGAGRVRVLYPVDPEDSQSVSGGREFELKGRGGREAFTVDEREGRGTIFAAVASQPFQFDDFARGGHWDYRALSADSTTDDEARLLDLADRMATGHYEYDLVTYQVWSNNAADSHTHAGWYGPRYFAPFYDPFYPYFGSRFSFGFGVRVGGRHFRRSRWWW